MLMLLYCVARQAQSRGQRTVESSVLHKIGDLIERAATVISNELYRIDLFRWCLLVERSWFWSINPSGPTDVNRLYPQCVCW